MNNILLIDKPSGMTSFDVIRVLRKKMNIKKMGHAGTLDPLATGLLIIGVEEGTKELTKFTAWPKEYEVVIELGKISNTYDADGEVQSVGATPPLEVPRAKIEQELKNFLGEIEQMPPVFSAKRVGGHRAYDLARKGFSVALTPQKIRIFALEILSYEWPFLRLRVRCSKGTYIRSLAHDLGQKLGCGGYVKELRRTAIGEFRVEQAQLL